jgi:hypothetical protein
MLIYSPVWLFLYPGIALVVVGSTMMAILATGERTVGGVTLGVDTLLYASLATVVGFEAVAFSRFLQFLGMRSWELPKDSLFERLESVIALEKSIVVGGLLVLVGIVGSLFAVGTWSATGFGGLAPEEVMRVTIPSVTAIMLRVQFALSGFLMYALAHGLGRRS